MLWSKLLIDRVRLLVLPNSYWRYAVLAGLSGHLLHQQPKATTLRFLRPKQNGYAYLQMIIVVGFKVNNERTVRFRKRAIAIAKDYTLYKRHLFKRRSDLI